MPEYVRALCREIRLAAAGDSDSAQMSAGVSAKTNRQALRTVYFGGGTPSLLSGEQVGEILRTLGECFCLTEDCEITLEANPGTIDEAKLRAFREAGVNRISLGIQSLDDSVLATLGRIHDAETARAAIAMVRRAGFTNISCDMMLGIPGQTLTSVRETVTYLLEQDIPHVSLYSLILEEGTPMYTRYGGDIEKFVSQEQDREMYHEVIRLLSEQGFQHYEISNMARPGFESRHNMMYWRAEQYYGFGVGAHYYLGRERGRHAETLEEYLEVLGDAAWEAAGACTSTGACTGAGGADSAADSGSAEICKVLCDKLYFVEETLTEEDCKKEFMMLGFRMGSGVDEQAFQARFGVAVASAFATELAREMAAGLLVHENGAYKLTERGFDLANQVFEDYI